MFDRAVSISLAVLLYMNEAGPQNAPKRRWILIENMERPVCAVVEPPLRRIRAQILQPSFRAKRSGVETHSKAKGPERKSIL